MDGWGWLFGWLRQMKMGSPRKQATLRGHEWEWNVVVLLFLGNILWEFKNSFRPGHLCRILITLSGSWTAGFKRRNGHHSLKRCPGDTEFNYRTIHSKIKLEDLPGYIRKLMAYSIYSYELSVNALPSSFVLSSPQPLTKVNGLERLIDVNRVMFQCPRDNNNSQSSPCVFMCPSVNGFWRVVVGVVYPEEIMRLFME